MGYDMYQRNPKNYDEEAHKAAEREFYAACDRRDKLPTGSTEEAEAQSAVTAAYDAMYETKTNYFRLNISGMHVCCQAMHRLGMLCNPEQSGGWPEAPSDDWPERDETTDPAWVAYFDQVDAHLSEHRGECPGIPGHKFSTNDGWIVTPAECQAALAAYRSHDAETVQRVVRETLRLDERGVAVEETWWPEWIDFLRRSATEAEGFEVR
jgi:hypothetical protein